MLQRPPGDGVHAALAERLAAGREAREFRVEQGGGRIGTEPAGRTRAMEKSHSFTGMTAVGQGASEEGRRLNNSTLVAPTTKEDGAWLVGDLRTWTDPAPFDVIFSNDDFFNSSGP